MFCFLYSHLIEDNESNQKSPILLTTFVLQIPNIVIVPPIEELQYYFGKLVISLLENHKRITAWGQRYTTSLKSGSIVTNFQGLFFAEETKIAN